MPPEGLKSDWWVAIPYTALDVPRGEVVDGAYRARVTDLLAEPVLFVDNFGVKWAPLYRFQVTW